jgi:hypothetical protein
MRYQNVETVVFTNINGISFSVKDMRDIPIQNIKKTIDYGGGPLDEIVSRQDVFGEYSEDQSYRIFEANLVSIFDAKFDMKKVKRLKIPS